VTPRDVTASAGASSVVAWTALAALVSIVAAVGPARAQQLNSPTAAYIYPAGGQQGTTVTVLIAGRNLEGATAPIVSGAGVHADVASYDKPFTGQQLTEMREKAQELQKKLPDPAIRRELQQLRVRIADSVRRNASPNLSELLTLTVTVDADAAPGERQFRVTTPLGLTGPVTFCVGQIPEVREKDEKDGQADSELTVTLPVTINGRIIPGDIDRAQGQARQPNQYAPGDVDRYRFAARKGQDIVAIVSARGLQPYLADAVPGWFQATLSIFDSAGREVAYDDDFRFQPDPALHFKAPADGDYVVEIKDAIYRGREDFVYRLTVGEIPFLTGIVPLGGPAGTRTTVELQGWNLPTTKLTMDVRKGDVGVHPAFVTVGSFVSNRLPFVAGDLPETVEREPNNHASEAAKVVLPLVVNGRIQAPGDVDLFSFVGRAGDRVVAEVTARRLGSPLDSTLELLEGQGKRVAFNDDHEDKASGLLTHQSDSYLMATLPASGTYVVRVADAQHKGGADYAYRLRLSAPRPDFELRIAPSDINVSAGSSAVLTACAIRHDGFAGDVAVALRDARDGFSLSGAVIPAGLDQVRMTLAAPPAPGTSKDPVGVSFEGRAVIEGRSVSHTAAPAEEMMQAFAYKHFVPADGTRVTVLARGAVRVPARVLVAQPVRVPAGGRVSVRVSLPPAFRTFENVEFELSEPPEGISLRDLTIRDGGAEFVLQADAAKVKAGRRDNLIVNVTGERVPPANQKGATMRRRLPLATLPAIALEVSGPGRP
jgi:hypothetical protein